MKQLLEIMEYSISETAKLTGVSVRTLHYYDEIGLLSPSRIISDTGYRYYNREALERLQQILFYRELDFSLKDIADIMNTSDYDTNEALVKQRELLILKRNRLNRLIKLIDANVKGDNTMSFDEFNENDINSAKDQYAAEVKERWGNTKAYEQSQEKAKKYNKDDFKKLTQRSNEIMKKFAANLGKAPESDEVQAVVQEWIDFITESYYDCTKEILLGLAQMYVTDERFTCNIDQFGAGTASLMSESIIKYCDKM